MVGILNEDVIRSVDFIIVYYVEVDVVRFGFFYLFLDYSGCCMVGLVGEEEVVCMWGGRGRDCVIERGGLRESGVLEVLGISEKYVLF